MVGVAMEHFEIVPISVSVFLVVLVKTVVTSAFSNNVNEGDKVATVTIGKSEGG
jgi:hypothetical protein